jgi:hypothetical protein
MFTNPDDKKGDHVYEGMVITDQPMKNETGVPAGHQRFHCEKCQAVKLHAF